MKYKPLSEIITVEEVTADKEKREEEIIKELNAPPQRMTAPKAERHRFRKLAEVLLNTIKTEGCFLWLEEIVSGKRICDRHKSYNGRLKIGSTGQGPFATFRDLREQLWNYVENDIISRIEPQSVDKWEGEKEKAIPSINYDQLRSFQYFHQVLIPEAIKYGFSAVHKCSEEVAETLLNKTSETIYFGRYREKQILIQKHHRNPDLSFSVAEIMRTEWQAFCVYDSDKTSDRAGGRLVFLNLLEFLNGMYLDKISAMCCLVLLNGSVAVFKKLILHHYCPLNSGFKETINGDTSKVNSYIVRILLHAFLVVA
ncbi:Integrase [Frankliniella fusca]|uniref:Integrase n=1 Tax=Frankliniella fusca TaxID=407009 RepID=A0AAE1GZT8_9NEOP|nr:Integrase [Frankliniella fusca]